MGFDYEIQNMNGIKNTVVDALFRIPGINSNPVQNLINFDMELTTISYPYFGWMDDIRRNSKNDKWIIERVKPVLDSSKKS